MTFLCTCTTNSAIFLCVLLLGYDYVFMIKPVNDLRIFKRCISVMFVQGIVYIKIYVNLKFVMYLENLGLKKKRVWKLTALDCCKCEGCLK